MSNKKVKILSTKFYECEKCGQSVPAYYIDTNGIKGLYVQCPTDGNHARPFISGLDLPYKINKVLVYKKFIPEKKKDKPKTFTTNHGKYRFRSIVIEDTPKRRHVKIVPA